MSTNDRTTRLGAIIALAAAIVLGAASAPLAARDDEPTPAPAEEIEALVEVLETLIEADGVSGHEEPVARAIRELLPEGVTPRVDPRGNVVVTLGGQDAAEGERIVFVAHMDEIGFIVTEIGDDGLLTVSGRGGFDPGYFDARAVVIRTGKGKVHGVVTPRPPPERPAAQPGQPAAPPEPQPVRLEDLRIDVGADDAAGVKKLGIQKGDPINVVKELDRLGKHRASGRAMDDRVGCTAQILALRKLVASGAAERLRDKELVFAFVVEEEVGLRGSAALARQYLAKGGARVVFAIDSFVTSDAPTEDPRSSHAKHGEGPVMRVSDRSHMARPADVAAVRKIARAHGIPIQIGVTGGGNDASAWVPDGARSFAIGWPLRSAHTAVETVDLRDVWNLARLVEALAEEF